MIQFCKLYVEPADLQKLVRKIADAPNYDFAAMEMLDALKIEWRDVYYFGD